MIIPILNTALNIGRGGRYFPDHWLFSKWAIVAYQTIIMAAGLEFFGVNPLLALLYIAPHALEMVIGTGEQMQAGNTQPFDIDMDKPLNQFLCWVLDINPIHATDADKRRLGTWYCFVIGVLFGLPFIYLNWYLAPIITLLHAGLIAGYRYIKPIKWGSQLDLRWRIFKEGVFFLIYSTLFWYCV